MPLWTDTIAPAVKSGKNVIIAAHGNSLRVCPKSGHHRLPCIAQLQQQRLHACMHACMHDVMRCHEAAAAHNIMHCVSQAIMSHGKAAEKRAICMGTSCLI